MKLIENNGLLESLPDDLLIAQLDGDSQSSGQHLRVIAVGDVGLSGSIGRLAESSGSCTGIFSKVTRTFNAADLVIANLETPLVADWSEDKLFAGSSDWASQLADSGIDVLHLASNHMLDHGADTFTHTITTAKAAGFTVAGAGMTHEEASQLVVRNVNGLKVGFLAAGATRLKQPPSPRLWEVDPLDVSELLQRTRLGAQETDILIVSLHWGPMLVDYPYLEQYDAAHEIVDAGASAVVMHHAHVMQGIEIYRGAPICYGLGNFLFDPDEGELQRGASNYQHRKLEEQLTGGMFVLDYDDTQFKRLTVVPVVLPNAAIVGNHEPYINWPCQSVARTSLDRLKKISDDLSGDFSEKLEKQLWAVRRWGLSIVFNLIVKGHEYHRIWHFIKRVRLRHIISLARRLMHIVKSIAKRK